MTAEAQKLTFAEHISELRKRLMWSLLFVAIGAGIGYGLHGAILDILQEPLNSKLYYTAPTGAFSFILKLCMAFGFIAALPVVVYQIFAFFGPLLPHRTKRAIATYVLLSTALAGGGVAFAYFISLPAALHFLVNFGNSAGNIEAIITADEYFNFVLAYIAGFAALFQLPLIVTFINRMTPLKPSQLLSSTRYVVLGSFIIAAVITPTPDPINQALMAGPVIVLYFLSVLVVALANRTKRSKQTKADKEVLLPVMNVEPVLSEGQQIKPVVPVAVAPEPVAAPTQLARHPVQPPAARRMVTDMVSVPRGNLALHPSTRPLQQRSAPPQSTVRQRPAMRMNVISDFIPASE